MTGVTHETEKAQCAPYIRHDFQNKHALISHEMDFAPIQCSERISTGVSITDSQRITHLNVPDYMTKSLKIIKLPIN